MILAIDPSINHLGYCIVAEETGYTVPKIVVSGCIEGTTRKEECIRYRIQYMLGSLSALIISLQITKFNYILLEKPKQWGSFKSFGSNQSGDLEKLLLVVGALTWWAGFYAAQIDRVHLIYPEQHKGQLPKDTTHAQMEKLYERKFATDHESDAVWIATRWLQGHIDRFDTD